MGYLTESPTFGKLCPEGQGFMKLREAIRADGDARPIEQRRHASMKLGAHIIWCDTCAQTLGIPADTLKKMRTLHAAEGGGPDHSVVDPAVPPPRPVPRRWDFGDRMRGWLRSLRKGD